MDGVAPRDDGGGEGHAVVEAIPSKLKSKRFMSLQTALKKEKVRSRATSSSQHPMDTVFLGCNNTTLLCSKLPSSTKRACA